jgi:hypothetical protein
MSDVSVWQNGLLKTDRAPASGELAVGNGTDFDLTQSNITFGNPLVIGVPVTVNGIVWSTSGGFKFPDNSVQTSAATTYTPPTYANNTIVANYSGSVAAPTGYSLSTILDDVFGTTQGTVLYRGASTWAALPPGTLGQFLQTQGASANPAWASVTPPPWLIVKKTSDQSFTSNTTLTNDTQLFFTAAANTTYAVQCVYSISAGSNGGFNIAATGPSSPTRFRADASTNGVAFVGYGVITTYGTIVSTQPNGQSFVFINMIIINGSTAGTVNMQISQAASSSTATVFEQGSYLQYAAF